MIYLFWSDLSGELELYGNNLLLPKLVSMPPSHSGPINYINDVIGEIYEKE
jgi:hypothetical protein